MDTSSDVTLDPKYLPDYSSINPKRLYRICTIHETRQFETEIFTVKKVQSKPKPPNWDVRKEQTSLAVHKDGNIISSGYFEESIFYLETFFPLWMVEEYGLDGLMYKHLYASGKVLEKILSNAKTIIPAIDAIAKKYDMELTPESYTRDCIQIQRAANLMHWAFIVHIGRGSMPDSTINLDVYPETTKTVFQSMKILFAIMQMYGTINKFILPILDNLGNRYFNKESIAILSDYLFLRQAIMDHSRTSSIFVPFSFNSLRTVNVNHMMDKQNSFNYRFMTTSKTIADADFPYERILTDDTFAIYKDYTVHSEAFAIDMVACKPRIGVEVPPYPSLMRLSKRVVLLNLFDKTPEYDFWFHNTVVENMIIYVTDYLNLFLEFFLAIRVYVKSDYYEDEIKSALKLFHRYFRKTSHVYWTFAKLLGLDHFECSLSKTNQYDIFSIECTNKQRGPYITPSSAAQGVFKRTYFNGEKRPPDDYLYPVETNNLFLNASIHCPDNDPKFIKVFSVLDPFMPQTSYPDNYEPKGLDFGVWDKNTFVMEFEFDVYWQYMMGLYGTLRTESDEIHGKISEMEIFSARHHVEEVALYDEDMDFVIKFFSEMRHEIKGMDPERARVQIKYKMIHEDSGDVLSDFHYRSMKQYEKNLWLSAGQTDPPILGIRAAANKPPLL